MNNPAINLVKDNQLLHEPIYSLGPVELKILKTYIKTNSDNDFIKLSKFPTNALILFIEKFDDSLCLYVNY